MTDRPIIFSAPMVRALLDGSKTQTRRLATSPLRRCAPGDRLYVRESFRVSPDAGEAWDPTKEPCLGWLDYLAGGCLEVGAPDFAAVLKILPKDVDWDFVPDTWRPSIHMPRWASRLMLIVDAVQVEPVQAITEADAEAEGSAKLAHDGEGHFFEHPQGTFRCGYAGLWDHLHGAGSWDANPEVVALTFRVISANIDQVPA